MRPIPSAVSPELKPGPHTRTQAELLQHTLLFLSDHDPNDYMWYHVQSNRDGNPTNRAVDVDELP